MSFDHTIKKGTTSKIIEVMIRDSSTGGGKTAVAHTDVTASYVREGGTRTAITLAAGAAGDSFSAGKWAEVDSTNCKGLYQLHLPDLALASGADAVTVTLQATGIIDKQVRISLLGVDLRDTADAGLTNLDAAVSTRSSFNAATDTVDIGKINGNATSASNLQKSTSQMVQGTVSSSPVGPLTQLGFTYFHTSDVTYSEEDTFIGRLLIFTSGNLVGQATDITDYEQDSGTGKGYFQVTATTQPPANTDTFIIV